MKKIKHLLLLFIGLSVGFSSCKKDDEKKGDIVGKWFLKSEVDKRYVNNQLQVTEEDTDFGVNDYIEFKADGTGIYSEEGDTDTFTYQLNDKGTELTTVDDGRTQTIAVTKLTSSELVLFDEDVETINGNTHRETTESTYKK